MGLFGWLFGRGDSVEWTEDDGSKHKGTVKGFKPEGFVEVKETNRPVASKFGGKLTKNNSSSDE